MATELCSTQFRRSLRAPTGVVRTLYKAFYSTVSCVVHINPCLTNMYILSSALHRTKPRSNRNNADLAAVLTEVKVGELTHWLDKL